MSDEPSTALAVLADLPGLGDPEYTPEVHRQRTEAFERAYDDPEEPEHQPAEVTPLGEYDHVRDFPDDPDLQAYQPPAQAVKAFAPVDWQLWRHLAPVALRNGVEPEQLAELANATLDFSARRTGAAIENANGQAEADLRKQHGKDYGQVMHDAEVFLDVHATPAERRALEIETAVPGLRVGSLPSVINLLARAGRVMRTGGQGSPAAGGRDTGMPTQQKGAAAGLRDQIKELEAKYPMGQRTRQQDAEIRKLYERAFPDDGEDATRAAVRMRG